MPLLSPGTARAHLKDSWATAGHGGAGGNHHPVSHPGDDSPIQSCCRDRCRKRLQQKKKNNLTWGDKSSKTDSKHSEHRATQKAEVDTRVVFFLVWNSGSSLPPALLTSPVLWCPTWPQHKYSSAWILQTCASGVNLAHPSCRRFYKHAVTLPVIRMIKHGPEAILPEMQDSLRDGPKVKTGAHCLRPGYSTSPVCHNWGLKSHSSSSIWNMTIDQILLCITPECFFS